MPSRRATVCGLLLPFAFGRCRVLPSATRKQATQF